MKRIVFADSRAIKITTDMRRALNSYNEKKAELEKVQNELKIIENSRTEKEKELETLNIQAMDSDKKVAKEASKKIKVIDKEMNKLLNDIKKENDKINDLTQQSKTITIPSIVLKSFKDFDKTEEINLPEPSVNTEVPTAQNNEIPVETIDNSFNEVQIINDNQEQVASEDNVLASEKDDGFSEEVNSIDIPSIEPVILENIDDSVNIEAKSDELKDDLESELSETQTPMIEVPEEEKTEDKVINNNFLSENDLDKMWDALNGDSTEEVNLDSEADNIETDIKEDKQSKDDKAEIIKPDIFGDDSAFVKISNKVVAPSPLIPEDNNTDLVPFSDYNDYVFKFGQDHYGKEALTPKEISDLSLVKNFLDNDAFESERSKQYNAIEKENDELRDRITHLDEDYKNQISDMSQEHASNLDELEKLIDKANNIIDDKKEKISNLENKNKNLNNTVNNQSNEIESLNTKKSELEATIDKLNNDIMELERIKEEHENKIKNYEAKFKEVLGIVREVKTDN